MTSFWRQVADPNDAAAAALDGLLKHLVSSDGAGPRLERTTVLDGDPLAAVREPKEPPGGEAQMHGSAGWPPLRTPRGLVDEYR